MELLFEERFFKNSSEWDYLLEQLHIPEEKRGYIDEIRLDVTGFEATDVDGNELKI